MKVIFLKDHKNGKKNEVKEISDGFAKNMLIPKGFAIHATKENINKHNAKLKKLEDQKNEKLKHLNEIKEKLEKNDIVITKKRTPKGLLEGSLTKPQFISTVKEQLDVELDHKNTDFKKINTFGVFELEISLGQGIKAKVTLKVEEK